MLMIKNVNLIKSNLINLTILQNPAPIQVNKNQIKILIKKFQIKR
jgi:hypothetical protein